MHENDDADEDVAGVKPPVITRGNMKDEPPDNTDDVSSMCARRHGVRSIGAILTRSPAVRSSSSWIQTLSMQRIALKNSRAT